MPSYFNSVFRIPLSLCLAFEMMNDRHKGCLLFAFSALVIIEDGIAEEKDDGDDAQHDQNDDGGMGKELL